MTLDEMKTLTPYQLALLDELRKLRSVIEDMAKALERAAEI